MISVLRKTIFSILGSGMLMLAAAPSHAGWKYCTAQGSGTCTTAEVPAHSTHFVAISIRATRSGKYRMYDTANGVTVASGSYSGNDGVLPVV